MEEFISLAHGGGGRLTAQLIEEEISPRFGGGPLDSLPDASLLPAIDGEPVYTADSFVVSPPFFPGGDIGSLAVHGTVNDLAVSGARPLWMTLGLILEEGLPIEDLRRILDSIKAAASICGVKVAAGDTKVVGRGQCDRIFISASGLGVRIPQFDLGMDRIAPGDALLVSGPLGDHGMAVLAARHMPEMTDGPLSDSGPVHRLVEAIAPFASAVKFMRDPTRGGLAAVLNEIASGRGFGFELDGASIPSSPKTRAVAEMLGMDLLNVACEGRAVLVCAASAAPGILKIWRDFPEGAGAALVGEATGESGRVSVRTVAGGCRLVDWPQGELLPRIC